MCGHRPAERPGGSTLGLRPSRAACAPDRTQTPEPPSSRTRRRGLGNFWGLRDRLAHRQLCKPTITTTYTVFYHSYPPNQIPDPHPTAEARYPPPTFTHSLKPRIVRFSRRFGQLRAPGDRPSNLPHPTQLVTRPACGGPDDHRIWGPLYPGLFAKCNRINCVVKQKPMRWFWRRCRPLRRCEPLHSPRAPAPHSRASQLVTAGGGGGDSAHTPIIACCC